MRPREVPAVAKATAKVVIEGDPACVFSRVAGFRNDGTLADVTVRAGGVEFSAHRVILAAGSDYLGALFTSGMRDAYTTVELDDVPAPVFQAFLDYVYEGRCEVEETILFLLLEAAGRLQSVALQQKVVAVVVSQRRVSLTKKMK